MTPEDAFTNDPARAASAAQISVLMERTETALRTPEARRLLAEVSLMDDEEALLSRPQVMVASRACAYMLCTLDRLRRDVDGEPGKGKR